MSKHSIKDDLISKIQQIYDSTVITTKALSENITKTLALQADQFPDAAFNYDPMSKDEIQHHIKSSLYENNYCSGAGFAFHLEGQPQRSEHWHLEWMYKKPVGQQPVNFELDKATQPHLDFSTFEWFKNAKDAKETYFHGPYVDYICNTSYTLTSAYPVYINDYFIGVAALDLLVSRIEEELLHLCSSSDLAIILTNHDKRIIFSNKAKYRVGEILKAENITRIYKSTFYSVYQPA